MRTRPLMLAGLALALATACGSGRDDPDPFATSSPGGVTTTAGSATTSSSGDPDGTDTDSGSDETDSATAGTGGPTPTTGGSGPIFDVGNGSATATAGDGMGGCEKVDFLFVVDNSGSMADEQNNLISAFPDFIDTIQSTLQAQDYHIMVVDTDALPDGGNCNGSPQSCCDSYCAADPYKLCGGNLCPGIEGCTVELGAGKAETPGMSDCGIAGGQRYIVDGQPDLPGTFACVANVGTGGDGNETPMDSMLAAIGPQNQAGACNEGFLRDDAVLVVTFITDEEDDYNLGAGSAGDPQSWYDAIVTAKNGDPTAVVVLGLIGDPDQPNPVCQPLMDIQGGEASPRLRAFVDLFGPRGTWGSVCAPNYGDFFEQAVSLIDTTCDDFVPPG